jgi:hypothetical protein
MARCLLADLFIRGVVDVAAHVPDYDVADATKLHVGAIEAPKAASGKNKLGHATTLG